MIIANLMKQERYFSISAKAKPLSSTIQTRVKLPAVKSYPPPETAMRLWLKCSNSRRLLY